MSRAQRLKGAAPAVAKGTGATSAPRMSGRALVLTPRGTYRAHVRIVDGLIHASDVELRRGAGWYSPAADRAWSPGKITELRWLEGAAA